MSKTKKIISMLLAVVMTMSLAPASVLASAFDNVVDATGSDQIVTTNGYVRSEPAATYFVDTIGTTEVIRIASNGVNSCVYGTAIVPRATPSGMPEITSGTFGNVAYAGETPKQTVVKVNFRNGVKPTNVTLVSSLGTNMNLSSAVVTESGTTTTYTWDVTGGTATVGTNVLYTISYKINGVDFVNYATAHVENILRPNGTLSVAFRDDKAKVRVSALVLFQGKNVYSGWVAGGGSNRAYIDYGSGSALDGGAIAGCGESGLKSSSEGGYAVADDANGTIIRAFGKGTFWNGQPGNWQFGYGYDKNRPLSNVYLDAAENETVETLNIRATYQNGESANCNYAWLLGIGVWEGQNAGNLSEDNSFNSYPEGTDVLRVATPIPGCRGSNGDQTYFVPANVTSTGNDNHKVIHFSGSGDSTSVYTVGTSSRGASGLDSPTGKHVSVHTGTISFKFNHYDSTSLRTLLNAIRLNAGVDVGGTVHKKGQHLNPGAFSAGWENFFTAYKNALYAISAPDINGSYSSKQAEIDGVRNALQSAYAALQVKNPSVNYTVNYTRVDSNVALLPSQTGTVNDGETLKTGAPVVYGFECQQNVTNTSQLVDASQGNITITYTYMPVSRQVILKKNNGLPDSNIECKYGYRISDVLPGESTPEHETELGNKEFYRFVGWYYDENFEQAVGLDDTMPMNNVQVYAKWETVPITISFDPIVAEPYQLPNGMVTPNPEAPVYFPRPADPVIDGYIFVDFYVDEELTTLVEWPMEFNVGDTDTTIYGRFEDVNGKISFESMGGTPVNTINYTSGDPINQPAIPQKQGYDFAGWFFDRDYTQPIPGWTSATYDSQNGEIVSSTVLTGTHIRNTMTGFVAYARWTPQVHSINFVTGINYNSEPSKFNTRNSALTSISGYSDSTIPQEDIDLVVIPTRFGYEFAYWSLDGQRYDLRKYPTTDITLTAAWKPVDYSAFVDILAYKMLDGEAVSVNEDNYGTGEGLLPIEQKPEVMKGDIITFRMSSKTNFYTGSSLFVFMYDKNFYELVGTGTSAFKLNPENDYISGLGVLDATPATFTAVTDSSLLRWPEGMDQSKYNAMQIAIDPNVTVSNYDTEPMQDESWILEFKLRIKDNATGSGEVFMDNAWTRSPENPMGTMFYGWSANRSPVMNTRNNLVKPDLKYTHSTVSVGGATPVYRTVNISSVNGALAGTFPDGSTSKSYTGRASTEILDYVGTPSLYGYHLDEGEEFIDGNGNFWIEGYYPTVAQGETPMSYVANWKVNNWTAKFYKSEGDASPAYTLTTSYGMPIEGVQDPSGKRGYTFGGWILDDGADGQLIEFNGEDPFLAPDNDLTFYGKWDPAPNKYTIKYMYGDTVVATKQYNNAVTDNIIMVVGEKPAPEDMAPNTVYLSGEDLDPGVMGYGFDENHESLPVSGVVVPNGSTEIIVYCKQVELEDLFDSGDPEALFPNGETEIFKYGFEGRTYESYGITEIEEPVRPGYTFVGFFDGPDEWTPESVFYGAWWVAEWEINHYPVYFTNNVNTDGTPNIDGITPAEIDFRAKITAPSAPSKEGYTFQGWKLYLGNGEYSEPMAANALGNLETEGQRIYVAEFTINNYNVSYEVDGEAYGEGATYDYGTTQTIIAYPEARTGYDFDGWYLPDNTQKNAGETYTIPANNIVITGSFVAKTIDIHFNAKDGLIEGAASKTVPTTFGTLISAPSAIPVREGYTFMGWSESADSNEIASFGILNQVEEKTYYAVWQGNETVYYIDTYIMKTDGTYDLDNPDSSEEIPARVGDTVTYTTPDAETGFAIDCEAVFSGTVPVPSSDALRLTVKYARNQYPVYKKLDASLPDSAKVELYPCYYGATIPTPAPYTSDDMPGYDFNGYSCEYTTMPALPEGVTFIGTWTAHPYPVSFFLTKEDSTGGIAPVSYANIPYLSTIQAPSVSREGYEFAGWARVGTDEPVDFNETVTVSIDGDSFYAKWDVIKYKLTYKANNGTPDKEFEVDYGTPKAELPVPETDPEMEGNTFAGWTSLPYETMPANDVTLVARWNLERYTINIDVDGGTPSYPAINEDYGTDISEQLPQTDPTKEGNYFGGWYVGDDEFDIQQLTTMPDLGDDLAVLDIKAKWIPESYNVKFNANEGSFTGGDSVKEVSVTYGAPIEKPDDPTREGYTFVRWYETDENVGFDFSSMRDIGENGATIELKAKWNINQYTITFDSDEGSAVNAITADYNAEITAPDAPTKEGYTFAGWYEADAPDAYVFTTMPAYIVELKAKWNINSYKIIYNAGEGKFADNETIKENTFKFNAPTSAYESEPTRVGYTFEGWFENGAIEAYNFTTMPAENVTLNAKWTVNERTITFDSDEGSAVAPIVANYGDPVERPANPTKEGYTFDNWYEGEATDPYEFTTMPAEDVNLTARWNINKYEISFNSDGGSEVKAIKEDYKTPVSAPEAPTKEGYTFAGWYEPDATEKYSFSTMPAYNVELKAKWSVNKYTIEFTTNGDHEVAPIVANYKDVINAPADPIRKGHSFEGWYEGDDEFDFDTTKTMPARNIKLTAKWSVNSYPIYFYMYSGEEVSYEYAYGTLLSAITVPEDSSRDGEYYTFAGWTLKEGGSESEDDIFNFAASEATIGVDSYRFYPVFVKTPVELIKVEGSTTVIEEATLPERGIIYGLETGLREENLEDYISCTDSGYIKVTPSFKTNKVSVCGTGTIVDLYDAETMNLVASYYLVIFGDLNGDGKTTTVDVSLAEEEAAREEKTWSDPNSTASFKRKAVNFDKVDNAPAEKANEVINAQIANLSKVSLRILDFVQTDGTTVNHKRS